MALDDLELVEPTDRDEWRRWLSQHHATSPGVWLAVGKKGNRRTALMYDDAVEEALCFGWIDSTVRRLDEDRTKQLYTPRKPRSTWAPSNKRRVERLIAEGRMTPAGMAAIEIARANGSWDLLDDIEAMVIPDDLAAALTAHADAQRGWETVPPSQRKIALYWIATARRPQTREARIAETVVAAAVGRGPRQTP